MNRHIFLSFSAIAAVLLLAGCDDISGGEAPETSAQVSPGVLRVEEREVERPDIFSRDGRGLWDGRISLGGRWVAIPEDIKADRVKITNESNGTIIEGALFQRDANLPGPYFMVSMDAAQALGMTPGVPAELSVVVVRTETIEIPAPVPVPVEDGSEEEETEGEGAGAPAAAAAEGAVATGAIAATALPEATAPAAGASGARPAAQPVTSPLEDTVLDALSRVEAGAGSGPGGGAAAPSAAAAPRADAGAPPPAPYLQVASGSNREGADAVVRRLKGADLPGAVRAGGSEAAPIYRVVAGPFETRGAYDAARATLRELGYEDAFATQ